MTIAPLHFEATDTSALDRQNNLKLARPRMLPVDDPNGIEFEFPILHGDEYLAFGCMGVQNVTEIKGRKTRIVTLDLARESTVDWVLDLKQWLHASQDDLSFFLALADGLVKAFQGRTDNHYEDVLYVAVTQEASLRRRGIHPPEHMEHDAEGFMVLAEALIPIHPETEAHS